MARDIDNLNKIPLLDDYFNSMDDLAKLLKKALDKHGTVTRGELRKALRRYEQVNKQSERAGRETERGKRRR